MSDTDKSETINVPSDSEVLNLSDHLMQLETIKGEIVAAQTLEQQLEKLTAISQTVEISEETLVRSIEDLNLPQSVSLPDVVIKEMHKHDIPGKLRHITKILAELILTFGTDEADPEDRSNTENSFRAMGVALQKYAGDHGAQVLRGRDTAMSLVRQLSKSVKVLTTVGEVFEIEVDEEKVEATIDFSKWPHDKLERLAIQLVSYSEKLIRQHETDTAKVQSLTSVVNEMKTKEEKIDDRVKSDSNIMNGKVEMLSASVKRVNEILSVFKDQDCWVVARVDSTTRLPARYYYEDEETKRIRNSKNMERAVVRSLKKAREVRFLVAQHLQDNARREEYRVIGETVVVMRVSLAEVDFASEYEE